MRLPAIILTLLGWLVCVVIVIAIAGCLGVFWVTVHLVTAVVHGL